MKIEPMSVEEIRRLVTKINWQFADYIGTESHERAGLILAWIHAEAQRRRHEFWADFDEWRQYLDDDEWLLEVKREVGWPEGE